MKNSIKFLRDQAVCTGEERTVTKKELKADLARVKEILKGYKNQMIMLSTMYDQYEYNQGHLHEMIGVCYVSLVRTKDNIRSIKKRIKNA